MTYQQSKPHRDLYQDVTNAIVGQIEAGAGQWVRPWAGGAGIPSNAVTGAEYRGVNILSLWGSAAARGYGAGLWASFKQWQAVGAQVRKGEKGTMIVYAGAVSVRDPAEAAEAAERKVHFLKCSHVFNAAQVDGFEAPAIERPALGERIAAAEAFVENTGAVIQYGNDRAFYAIARDIVAMPDLERFTGTPTSTPTEAFYGVLLHELTHWTGHAKRCDRQFGKRFGDQAYAAEELVAELGAAFLCAKLGITAEPRADHAQYLASWLQILKGDKRAIFTAASKASAAVDYLMAQQESKRAAA